MKNMMIAKMNPMIMATTRNNLQKRDVAANDEPKPDTVLPVANLGAEQLEVYGWESSLWKKIRGYLGL